MKMKTSARILSALFLAALFLWPQSVPAQSLAGIVCMERSLWSNVFENMGLEHTSKGIGINDYNSIYEILVTEDGHWVLLKTFTNGQSCRISEGIGWMWFAIEKEPEGQGA